MNLPDMSNVQIPKRMSVILLGVYLVKDIEQTSMALIVAGLIAVGLACQTWTDIKGKKPAVPEIDRE